MGEIAEHFPGRAADSLRRRYKTKSKIRHYTEEEQKKIVDLRENQGLTWGEVAKHFHGRTLGSLRRMYKTKLMAKNRHYTEEERNQLVEPGETLNSLADAECRLAFNEINEIEYKFCPCQNSAPCSISSR